MALSLAAEHPNSAAAAAAVSHEFLETDMAAAVWWSVQIGVLPAPGDPLRREAN